MNRVTRSIAAVLLCAISAVAAAQALQLQQADGKLLAIVDDGTAGPFFQQLERRLADGRLDPSFGRGGRVAFSLGADSLEPRSLRIDSRGRLLIIGSAFGSDDRSQPVTLRFTPDGRADATWGVQGRSIAPSPQGDAVGVDVLALADDSVLLLGQLEAAASDRVALWRLRSDGGVDAGFGRSGVMLASGLDGVVALNLQLGDDGAALIAVQRQAQGRTWLEVHRWASGPDEPQLVARQPAPLDWQGPPHLERNGGSWQWASERAGADLSRIAVAGAGAWAGSSLASAAADAIGGTTPSAGEAAFNPFAAEPVRSTTAPEIVDDNLGWPAWALGSVAALLALAWWRFRKPRAIDIGLLNPLDSQIDAAVRSIGNLASIEAEIERPLARSMDQHEMDQHVAMTPVVVPASIGGEAAPSTAAPESGPPVAAEPAPPAPLATRGERGGCRNRLA
jgi:uncharacterized delta-60 repeat protein